MSLFGALYSGVSGLQAQSSALGAIADNVTNVNTVGFKGTQVNFRTLVTSQVSLTQYSPGGVQAAPRQTVDLQGLLQATTSSTDVAMSGQGFFVTNEAANPVSGDQFAYTRAGSFRVDQEGYLQNAGGFYMQGWPLAGFDGSQTAAQVQVGEDIYMKSYIDTEGDRVLVNDNVIDARNLQPLNIQTIGGTASPTTTVSIGANLSSDALVGSTERVNNLIFDSLGNAHNMTYEFNKVATNSWGLTIEPPAQAAVIELETTTGVTHFSAGRLDFLDSFTAPITGTIEMSAGGAGAQTLNLILGAGVADDAAWAVGGGANSNMAVDTNNRTLSQILDLIATRVNTFLSDVAVQGAPPTVPGNWARRIPGENGLSFTQGARTTGGVAIGFTAKVNDAVPNSVVVQNAVGGGGFAAGYSVPVLDDTRGWFNVAGGGGLPAAGTLNQTSIDFSGAGVPLRLFGVDESTATTALHSVEISWANGAADMEEGSAVSPDIKGFLGNFGTPDGLTQLAGDFQLNFLSQNGAKFGNFAGVSIGEDGVVTALFDNGVTKPVFMIPVATFTNANGLNSLSGNVWTSTDNSGAPVLREAGSASAGAVQAAALESSTVDLGQEFTKMITTQRAYSSAAKVITTSDEMLDELLRIKR
ncbi:MAG: flagellar hook protein FlgE [Rhodospirillaceae bacterium]